MLTGHSHPAWCDRHDDEVHQSMATRVESVDVQLMQTPGGATTVWLGAWKGGEDLTLEQAAGLARALSAAVSLAELRAPESRDGDG